MEGDVLVPGCGLGYDVRAIAGAFPAARVLGLDIAASALDQAGRFSVTGEESYECGDLLHLRVALTGRFDWVFEHTCFCAIEPRERNNYVGAMIRALRPAGFLLGIFFLNPWDPGEAPQEGGPPFAVSREELDSLFAAHFELIEELRPHASYPGREGREIVRLLRRRSGVN